MGLLRGAKEALKIAGRIDNKYNINKIFVEKYVPPGYKKLTKQIFDVAGTIGGGYGIVRFIESLYADDSPGSSAPIPFEKQKFTKTDKSYKTRSRYPKRYNRCRDQYRIPSNYR